MLFVLEQLISRKIRVPGQNKIKEEKTMSRLIDLTNQTFGKLTVLKQDPKRASGGNVKWICQCECGNITSVSGTSLRNGKTTSCGCNAKSANRKGTREYVDLTGQQIGEWTVLEKVKIPGRKNATYLCRCSCGTERVVEGRHLKDGSSKSCGCQRKIDNPSVKDLSGQRFGKLTVLKRAGSDNRNHALWLCQCDCGNQCIKSGRHLVDLTSTSCGCNSTSSGENLIEKYLDEHNIKYQREYTFPDLYGNVRQLRFDFGIFNENSELTCLIEYQGEQHFKASFGLKEEDLQRQIEYDKKKQDYANKINIPLIIIPYTDKEVMIEKYLVNIKQ